MVRIVMIETSLASIAHPMTGIVLPAKVPIFATILILNVLRFSGLPITLGIFMPNGNWLFLNTFLAILLALDVPEIAPLGLVRVNKSRRLKRIAVAAKVSC